MARAVMPVAAAAITIALSLTSCAHHRPAASAAAEPAAAIPPRPILPAGYAALVVPPLDPDGRYRTINAGIGEEQTIWHVRAALNVAAIGCRGPENAGLVASYNSLLTARKAVLAKANKAVEAGYRAQGGDWQDAHDRYMTRLYNFFAMPQAQAGFCAAAASVAPRAAATPAAEFPSFAETALPELEAPFVAVYRTVDDWKTRTAEWDARYGPDAKPTELAAGAAAGSPKLAYAKFDKLFAWQPRDATAIALR